VVYLVLIKYAISCECKVSTFYSWTVLQISHRICYKCLQITHSNVEYWYSIANRPAAIHLRHILDNKCVCYIRLGDVVIGMRNNSIRRDCRSWSYSCFLVRHIVYVFSACRMLRIPGSSHWKIVPLHSLVTRKLNGPPLFLKGSMAVVHERYIVSWARSLTALLLTTT